MIDLMLYWVRATAVAILAAAVPLTVSAQTLGGDPPARTNLSASELADFRAGLALFKSDFTPSGDPRNEDQCSDCHFRPLVGGNGFMYHGAIFHAFTYDRPAREIGVDRWPADRKDLGFQGTRFRDQNEDAAIPHWTNAVSRRVPRSLFGIGSLDQIPQSAILANEDADDLNGDGISGRALGRYGSQGQFESLDATIRTVFTSELGVAPSDVRNENVRLVGAFLRGLRDPVYESTIVSVQGQATFTNIGCADCHVARYTLPSGRSIQPYSDFLVHDMGSCLDDGVTISEAKSYEWRTPPLWGVDDGGASLMHDARGGRLDQVVAFHCGEAQASRDAYLALPQADQIKVRGFMQQLKQDF